MNRRAGNVSLPYLYNVPQYSLHLSVDSQTDAKIQEIIRSEFQDRTIIMIAHRLDTLLDFDKIAVLDGGALVEIGAPAQLLANQNGAFSKLYRLDKSRKGKDDGS